MTPKQRRSAKRVAYAKCGGECHWCGRPLTPFGPSKVQRKPMSQDAPTLDHLLPRTLGGTDAQKNLVLACHKCNRWRGSVIDAFECAHPERHV